MELTNSEGASVSKQVAGQVAPGEWPAWWSTRQQLPLQERVGFLESPDGTDRFPILRDIPRFVANEGYAENFGDQWKRFRTTQLDSFTGHPISRNRLRRCLGEELWSRLSGAQVLEVGCGAGRFTEVLLQEGALVTSVDLSEAVDANAENFPISDRHRIAQADLLALPFPANSFDLVLCLGVLQHTPSPERSVAALAQHVREGGSLVIDHYTWTWGRVTSTKPLFRAVLKRLRRTWTLPTVGLLVDLFLPMHRALRHTRFAWSALCRISPITTFYKSYPDLPENLQREWARLDTHDSLTDWYKHLRTSAQVAAMIENAGLSVVKSGYEGNGVEAVGRRVPDNRTTGISSGSTGREEPSRGRSA